MTELAHGRARSSADAAEFITSVGLGARPTEQEWFRVLPAYRKIADAVEWHACIVTAAALGDPIAALWRELLPITQPTEVDPSHWLPLPDPGSLDCTLLVAEVALARGSFDGVLTLVDHARSCDGFIDADVALVDELFTVYLAAAIRSGDLKQAATALEIFIEAGRVNKLVSVMVRLWNSHSFDELIWLADAIENRVELTPIQFYDFQRVRLSAAPLASGLSFSRLCELSKVYSDWIERLPIPAGQAKEPLPRSRFRVGVFWMKVSVGIDLPAFIHRDRSLYECILYTSGDMSAEYWGMVGDFDAVRAIGTLPTDAAAEMMVQDDLDILVVLDSLGDPSADRIIAAKPASKIVFYGNCLATVGLKSVDAILVPPDLVDRSTISLFSEPVVTLDLTVMVSGNLSGALLSPAVDTNGPPVIGAVASSFKLNRLWMERVAAILRAVPEAIVQLDVYSARLESGGYLLRMAQALGIPPHRLKLRLGVQFTPLAERLAPLSLVIDTAPLGSNLTALQCLSAGVPLLTCPDERPGSRHAMTILRAIGAESLIAASEQDLVARAVALLTNRDELRQLRRSLPDKVRSSGIADPFVVARVFEAGLLALLGR